MAAATATSPGIDSGLTVLSSPNPVGEASALEPYCLSAMRSLFEKEGLIFQGQAMFRVARQVEAFTDLGLNRIFIQGETGTGKDKIAELIYKRSVKLRGLQGHFNKFVANHAPDELAATELFGHKRGSFTGAVYDRVGAVEDSQNGVLFVDEVQDLSPKLQSMLLQLVQSGEYTVVGTNAKKKSNAIIVAASNQDLLNYVNKGKFRADLYYRLVNGGKIVVPPLRERKEDIPDLARFIVERFNGEHGTNFRVDSSFISVLMTSNWPGNIRELEGVVTSTLVNVFSEQRNGSAVVRQTDLPPDFNSAKTNDVASASGIKATLPFAIHMQSIEAELIKNALLNARGNQSLAAKRLGLKRSTLVSKIRVLTLAGFDFPYTSLDNEDGNKDEIE